MKTAEEFVNDKLGDKNYTHSPYPIYRKELIEWLQEYADQQPLPSDEEIEKEASESIPNYEDDFDETRRYYSWIEGAMWMRDNYQPKQIDWEDECKLFLDSHAMYNKEEARNIREVFYYVKQKLS